MNEIERRLARLEREIMLKDKKIDNLAKKLDVLTGIKSEKPWDMHEGGFGGDYYVKGNLYVGGTIYCSGALLCRVYRSTTQNTTTGSYTTMSYDTELYDLDGCWASGNPTNLYAGHDGFYDCGAAINLDEGDSDTSVQLAAFVYTGGNSIRLANNNAPLYATNLTDTRISVATGAFWMYAGDYVYFQVWQSSSGTRTIAAADATGNHYCNSAWLGRRL